MTTMLFIKLVNSTEAQAAGKFRSTGELLTKTIKIEYFITISPIYFTY